MLSGAGRSAADDRASTRKGGSVELVQADRENEADRRKKGRKTLKKIGEGKFPLAYLCQILRLIDNRMDLGVVLLTELHGGLAVLQNVASGAVWVRLFRRFSIAGRVLALAGSPRKSTG